MAKPELGVKRDCPDCGARFYDLNKSPAHCPKCGNDFEPEPLLKPRRTRKDAEDDEARQKKAEAAEAEAEEKETDLESADEENAPAEGKRKAALDEDEDEDDDEDDVDFPADDSILEDDDDDVADLVPGDDEDE